MAVEYDLIIIGATAAAQSAAIAAAQTYARTAWVSEVAPALDPLFIIREGSRLCQRPLITLANQAFKTAVELITSAEWASPVQAQAEGVDYREGSMLLSSEGVTVAGQVMKARAYLLALESAASLPAIPGIIHPKIWTITQLYQRLLTSAWPESIGVLGNGPQAVELSQSLQRLGLSVSLVTGGPLLPHEDREMAFLLQTYLEGSGIKIYSQSLQSVQSSTEGLYLDLGDFQISVTGLVTATESSLVPESVAALNLRRTSQGLWVNSALQTSISSIYACGGLLGGYRLSSIGNHEGQTAVRNALFQSQTAVRYHQLPYAVMSSPGLARVGLTEQQARLHDPDVQVIRQTCQDQVQVVLTQAPAGLCKVLVQPDGTLLGAHLVGAQAAELIHLFAFALQQGVRLQDLGKGGFASPTFSEVIQSICVQWRWQQSQQNRSRLERGFLRQRRRASSYEAPIGVSSAKPLKE